jgi:hypothetical protein
MNAFCICACLTNSNQRREVQLSNLDVTMRRKKLLASHREYPCQSKGLDHLFKRTPMWKASITSFRTTWCSSLSSKPQIDDIDFKTQYDCPWQFRAPASTGCELLSRDYSAHGLQMWRQKENVASWEVTLVPLQTSWLPVSDNSDQWTVQPWAHFKMPLLSRVSNCQILNQVEAALQFSVKWTPPMTIWHQAHWDKCFFSSLFQD